MIAERLAQSILFSPKFHSIYERLLSATIIQALKPHIEDERPQLNPDEVGLLVQCAVLLAGAPEGGEFHVKAQDRAYRIVTLLWQYYREQAKPYEDSIYSTLALLGNFPSADQLFSKQDASIIHADLPLLPFAQLEAQRQWNTRQVGSSEIVLTNFQSDLWDEIATCDPVAVSAPTSSGKSFVLTRYLLTKYFGHKKFIAAYIVPTKTLITEISTALHEQATKLFSNPVNVLQAGIPPSELNFESVIYVLTQERLTGLLDDSEAPVKFDVVIIDEAQSVADGRRGNLLIQCIEKICDGSPGTQILFGLPLVSNVSCYSDVFGLPRLRPCTTDTSPVSQNFICLKRVNRKPGRYTVEAICGDERLRLPIVNFPGSIPHESSDRRLLAYFATTIGAGAPTLIYSGKPHTCIEVAKEVASVIDAIPDRIDHDFVESTAKFIEDYIHQDFSLAKLIRYGVAYHFGRLPHTLTKILEQGFIEGKFPVLVSTSTLLHGVNLPAKNLFLLRPTKGQSSEKLSHVEFWNLAGRAGRLGKDFEGNVFVIEPKPSDDDRWSQEYIDTDRRQEVSTPLQQYLTDEHGDKLIDYVSYIVNGAPFLPDSDEERDTLASIYTKMFADFIRGNLRRSFERNATSAGQNVLSQVEPLLKAAKDKLAVPESIILKHTNLLPDRIDTLYRKLKSEGRSSPLIQNWAPIHPMQALAFNRLYDIFLLFRDIFGASVGNQAYAHAAIAGKWMQGKPLKAMINQSIEIDLKKAIDEDEEPPTPDASIRNLLRTITDTISFKYANLMRCYIDIIYSLSADVPELFAPGDLKIAPVDTFLEFGVSEKTQISMMNCGLSRMTTVEVYPFMRKDVGADADVSAVRAWFNDGRWIDLPLPLYFMQEIAGIFLGKKR